MIKTYMPNRHKVQRMLMAWVLCLVVMLTSMLATSLTASAAGSVGISEVIELAYAIQQNSNKADTTYEAVETNDWAAPTAGEGSIDANDITNKNLADKLTYGRLSKLTDGLDKNYIRSDKTPILYRYATIARTLQNGFANQTTFDAAVKKLCNVAWKTTVTDLTPQIDGNTTQNQLTSAISGFTSTVAQGTVTDAFSGTFDMSGWDPNAGVAGAAMSTIGSIVNQVFFVVSNLMMLLFMAQTGFDVLYLLIEPLRPFISKPSGGGGMGGNAAEGTLSKIHIPIVSSSAIEAANGGAGSGGLGGNGAGSSKANMVLKYLISRAPVLILGAIYLILVTMGYWQQLIGWIAGFVIQALDWLMTLGG